MKERKVWNPFEDKILRFLKQQRGEKKWSVIARKMEEEFQIAGRTGKQCRERYHNHLDSTIVTTEWTEEEDEVLFNMHEEYGNKWSSISQNLPGRSDNCVKNRFYSKLRKSVRRLNKFIIDNLSRDYQTISSKLLSKIVETTQLKTRSSCRVDEETIQYSIDLKNRLFNFESFVKSQAIDTPQEIELVKQLIEDIFFFDKNIKKPGKVLRKRTNSFDEKDNFLHPKMCLKGNRSISITSSYSDNSSEMSFGLSSSNISSFEDDHDEDIKPRKGSYTTRSSREIHSRNSSDILMIKNEDVFSNGGDPQLVYKETQCQLDFNDLSMGWLDCNEKLSMSLIEEYPIHQEKKEKHRSSLNSNKSSSNHSNASKMFARYDDFCEIDQHFRNMNAENSFSQIVWRIIQPKQRFDKFDRILQEDDLILPGQNMDQE